VAEGWEVGGGGAGGVDDEIEFAPIVEKLWLAKRRFHDDRVEGPVDSLGATLRELGRLDAVPTTTSTHGPIYLLEGEILATRMNQLQVQLLALTHGEGVLEFSFDHYRPVRGTPPSRPRTDNNPLNIKEYMLHVPRRV
jgi:ribosomal protection tetracycline resistance protein